MKKNVSPDQDTRKCLEAVAAGGFKFSVTNGCSTPSDVMALHDDYEANRSTQAFEGSVNAIDLGANCSKFGRVMVLLSSFSKERN